MKTSHLGILALAGFVGFKIISKSQAKVAQLTKQPLQNMPDTINGYYSGGSELSPSMLGCLADLGCTLGDPVESLGCECEDGLSCAEGVNGLGRFSLKKTVQRITAPVQKIVKKVAAPVVKQVKKDIAQAKRVTRVASKRIVADIKRPIHMQVDAIKNLLPHHSSGGGGGSDNSAAAADAVQYQDENGNPISEAQYNALMAQPTSAPMDGDAYNGDDYSSAVPVEQLDTIDANAMPSDGANALVDSLITPSDESYDPYSTPYDDSDGASSTDMSSVMVDDLATQEANTSNDDMTTPNRYQFTRPQRSAPRQPLPDDMVDADEATPDDAGADIYVAEEVPMFQEFDAPNREIRVYGGEYDAVMNPWDGGDGLGQLIDKRSRRALAVVTQNPGQKPVASRLKVDGKGGVWAWLGAALHRLGDVDGLAGAEGLGFKIFGKSYGDIRKKVVKVERAAHDVFDPVAIGYKQLTKHATAYKKYRKIQGYAAPYEAIVGGAALTVVTVGAGSAAGAVAIAGGVANIGAQAYKDNQVHKADVTSPLSREYDPNRIDDGSGTNTGASTYDPSLQEAGESAVQSDGFAYNIDNDTTTGETDDDSLMTIGEMLP